MALGCSGNCPASLFPTEVTQSQGWADLGFVGQGKVVPGLQAFVYSWPVEVESWFCFVDKCLSGCLSLRPAVGRVEISQHCPAVSSVVLRGVNSLPGGPEKAKRGLCREH